MNDTLDDRGEEVGLSRSGAGARLRGLAAVSFAVIQPDTRVGVWVRGGGLKPVTRVFPSTDNSESGLWNLQSPTLFT